MGCFTTYVTPFVLAVLLSLYVPPYLYQLTHNHDTSEAGAGHSGAEFGTLGNFLASLGAEGHVNPRGGRSGGSSRHYAHCTAVATALLLLLAMLLAI
jgi:hypothetical protein